MKTGDRSPGSISANEGSPVSEVNLEPSTSATQSNPPPSAGYLYFGHAHIEARTGRLTVTFRDLANRILHSQSITPDR